MASNQEILEKAIQKAIDGGLDILYKDWSVNEGCSIEGEYRGQWLLKDWQAIIYAPPYRFAKALWGESLGFKDATEIMKKTHADTRFLSKVKPWQYHLQQMVIADDPIKYLGENL